MAPSVFINLQFIWKPEKITKLDSRSATYCVWIQITDVLMSWFAFPHRECASANFVFLREFLESLVFRSGSKSFLGSRVELDLLLQTQQPH